MDMRNIQAIRDNRENPERTEKGHSDMKQKRKHGGVPSVKNYESTNARGAAAHAETHAKAEQRQREKQGQQIIQQYAQKMRARSEY